MKKLKQLFKRAASGALAAITIAAGVPPAMAASFSLVKSATGYTYLSEHAKYPEIHMATIASNGGEYAGLPAYCLEFYEHMADEDQSLSSSSLSDYLSKNCSETAAQGIRCASIFGYPNYNNGADAIDNYIAYLGICARLSCVG